MNWQVLTKAFHGLWALQGDNCPYTPPSPFGASFFKNNGAATPLMVERHLQLKNEDMAEPVVESKKDVRIAESLENEIECPRCHDDMTLCSEFDNLYYFCKECDFCLFTLKRN